MDCLFCKIANGIIPVEKIYEDDLAIAFRDINPQAPVHILVIPRRHVDSLAQLSTIPEDNALLGHLLAAVVQIAQTENLSQGYRTVINTGSDGGQTVGHMHLHLLGGRAMHWPPG